MIWTHLNLITKYSKNLQNLTETKRYFLINFNSIQTSWTCWSLTLTLRSAEGISDRLEVTRVSSKSNTRVLILFSSEESSGTFTGRVRGSAPSMNSDNAPLFFTLLRNAPNDKKRKWVVLHLSISKGSYLFFEGGRLLRQAQSLAHRLCFCNYSAMLLCGSEVIISIFSITYGSNLS